jgi:hypothetical protein
MSKYLSFSLWGDKPLYNIGAIRNAEIWKTIYPEWDMIVYYDNSVPKETIDSLISLNVTTIDMTNSGTYGMFWRFFAVSLPNCELAIFRDTDSRISIREKMAVDEWIESKKSLHVMRDHPAHGIPYGNNSLGILGGMWGIKNGTIPLIDMMQNFFSSGKVMVYGDDQRFLKSVYSILENDRCTHDDFFEKKPFPIKRENGRFIGERIDIIELPLTDDYKILL